MKPVINMRCHFKNWFTQLYVRTYSRTFDFHPTTTVASFKNNCRILHLPHTQHHFAQSDALGSLRFIQPTTLGTLVRRKIN